MVSLSSIEDTREGVMELSIDAVVWQGGINVGINGGSHPAVIIRTAKSK